MKKGNRRGILAALRLPVLVLLAALYFFYSLSHVESSHGEEGRRQLEETIRRSAVACYANEGIYPPDLEYLERHYGVQIDEEHYAVFYDAFAENLMPDITVVEIES